MVLTFCGKVYAHVYEFHVPFLYIRKIHNIHFCMLSSFLFPSHTFVDIPFSWLATNVRMSCSFPLTTRYKGPRVRIAFYGRSQYYI